MVLIWTYLRCCFLGALQSERTFVVAPVRLIEFSVKTKFFLVASRHNQGILH